MGHVPGEQPPEPPPQPAGNSLHLEARSSGQARVNQAAGDEYLPYPDGVRGAASGYDAFISYSRALDGALAPALQTGLERFAKPWYRSRALRVFRDTASLSANPGLWSSIEKALASSAWLVLMASPEAARSKWVNREVAWWLAHKSPQAAEGEQPWGLGDEVVQRLFVGEAGRLQQRPLTVRTLLLPDRRHERLPCRSRRHYGTGRSRVGLAGAARRRS